MGSKSRHVNGARHYKGPSAKQAEAKGEKAGGKRKRDSKSGNQEGIEGNPSSKGILARNYLVFPSRFPVSAFRFRAFPAFALTGYGRARRFSF
jgi:hypothetical protein